MTPAVVAALVLAAAGGVVSTVAGIVTRKLWKRVTHTEAMVAAIRQESGPPPEVSQL